MKLQEEDLQATEVSPAAIAAYLRSIGWKRTDDLVRKGARTATQFVSATGATSIWLPLLPETRDYARLLAQAVNTIAEEEARSPEMVLGDVRLTRADLIRVRRPERHDHAIPLKHAPALFTGARDLVAASAMAAHDPRPAFPGRRHSKVVEFLDTVMLGQTEPSSFGIRLLLPLPPSTTAQMALANLGEDASSTDRPFARKVSLVLATALERAREAAASALVDGTFEQFGRAVEAGVSAELCRAIAMLSGDDWGSTVEVSVRYGRVLERRPSLPIVFHGETFGVLQDAAGYLADREPRLDVELEGVVVALRHEGAATGQERQEGRLTLGVVIDGNVKKVNVVLPEPIYSRAVDAYKVERRVAITGNLVREGQKYTLSEPHGFVVLD